MKKIVICFCIYMTSLTIADIVLELAESWLFCAGFITHAIYSAIIGDDNDQS